MEQIVIAATITGIAAIIAASIQAIGNISAARHKAADAPAANEVKQADTTCGITVKRRKPDWSYWGILSFLTFWWLYNISLGDVYGSRIMLGLIILLPLFALLMIVVKIIMRLLRLE
jgi:hypothetical protein